MEYFNVSGTLLLHRTAHLVASNRLHGSPSNLVNRIVCTWNFDAACCTYVQGKRTKVRGIRQSVSDRAAKPVAGNERRT
jgi:hypothetical protein